MFFDVSAYILSLIILQNNDFRYPTYGHRFKKIILRNFIIFAWF